ncbi:nitrous oxide-stimulated promoter family protein [Campylobacter sp. RM15925]|uniref:nitrous oxide-stimulated promoter family protein n=1 Tax=Campylobacter sp. RM15925 TaxID=1705724 RepID=UPI0014740BA7|nr:nitrous oxide-stimulated promoter family protein [Campylobacter sp. RM15925]
MTQEKFIEQVSTMAKFLSINCKDNHPSAFKNEINLNLAYKGENLNFNVSTSLCKECEELFYYAHERLSQCPHEVKPSCRKCPHPCYEKSRWKQMAKIMRYSGMKLGLTKIKKMFGFRTNNEH